MFALKKSKLESKVEAPCRGLLKKLKDSNDQVFCSGALGKGCFIQPRDSVIYAPISGRVTSLFSTNHAFAIEGKDGLQVLVHIGIDTVYLKENYIHSLIKKNDYVHRGDQIMDVEFELIRQAGYCNEVYVFITNPQEYEIEQQIEDGIVSEGDTIFRCRRIEDA